MQPLACMHLDRWRAHCRKYVIGCAKACEPMVCKVL